MTGRKAIVTRHWCERVAERLGAEVPARALAGAIAWEIENDTGNVEYIGRVNRDGRRAYRFSFSETICGAALLSFDDGHIRFITMLPSGFRIARQGKDSRRA